MKKKIYGFFFFVFGFSVSCIFFSASDTAVRENGQLFAGPGVRPVPGGGRLGRRRRHVAVHHVVLPDIQLLPDALQRHWKRAGTTLVR